MRTFSFVRAARKFPALRPSRSRAFTLVEILVATAILLVIIVVLLQITGKMTEIWKSSAGKISAFQSARSAFSTITRTVARANLNTYNDYVGVVPPSTTEVYRTNANSATFTPVKFERTSELHFLSGLTSELLTPDAQPLTNPGHCIFFQAAMGETDDTGNLKSLNRTLNSVGFYIQYGDLDSSFLPTWLKPFASKAKRFRLVEFVEPTEKLNIYTYTDPLKNYTDMFKWIANFLKPASGAPRARVLAEDVLLLVVRPRLSPKDEQTLAGQLGGTYDPAAPGAILCPGYNYDSRAWQTGYPPNTRVKKADPTGNRVKAMRNQAPPIVDIAMVCADRQSMARFDQTSATPIAQVAVGSLFTDSAKLVQDLDTYGRQLSAAKIRYRVFRTSVDVQSAKWSANLN